jgi:hypothetical protein
MELSGIYNSIDSEGNPYHDPGSGSYEYGGSWKDLSVLRDPSKTKIGNDVELYGKKVGDKWIEFRDDGDYGQTRRPLDLRSFDQVTVEICFRVDTANDTANSAGVLYEMPSPPNYFTGAIGAGINTERYGEWYFPRPGKAYTIGKQGNQNDSNATENYFIGMRNYEFSLDPSKFTTHTTVYSCIDDPTGRQTFVDGVAVPYYEHVINASLKHPASTRTYAANSPEFRNDYLYIVEYEMDGDSQLPCDIAAMRIYGRKLNPDEIARNAALDQLLYNG